MSTQMKWARGTIQRWRQTEQGQNMLEFALMLPMLLILVLGTIDIGLGFRTYIALTNAAREGVRWISIHPSECAEALARVENEAARVGISKNNGISDDGYTAALNGTCPYSAGEKAKVSLSYDHELLFGSLTGLPPVTFTGSATMVVLYDE